jgi:hypothetical protein
MKANKIIFFSFCLAAFNLHAQQSSNKLWTEIGVDIPIARQWELGLSQNLRLKENYETIDNFFTEADVHFNPSKKIDLSAQLRFLRKNDNSGAIQGYQSFFRYRLAAEFKHKIKLGKLAFRSAYQKRNSLQGLDKGKQAIRFKPSFELNIKNWSYDPTFFIEYIKEVEGDLEKSYRYGLSTSIKVAKNQKLGVRYFLETSKDVTQISQKYHVLRLKYNLEWNRN